MIDRGSTATVCALDISKAFDKVDHYGLFLKLLKRDVPLWFVQIMSHWYDKNVSVVRWCNTLSYRFQIKAGVRQGGILSPYLFNVYIDSLIERLAASGHGFYLLGAFLGCIVYADDILLISKTISGMQNMLDICSSMAIELNVKFNVAKSMVLRIGARFSVKCAELVLCNSVLARVEQIKYLGVTLKSGRKCAYSFKSTKMSFYRCFNAVDRKMQTPSW